MRFSREQAYVRCLSAAICLLAMFSSSQPMVLCLGHDGHVAIEASGSACCGHLPWVVCEMSRPAFGAAGRSAEDDDCGPCLDIPISSGSADAFEAPDQAPPDLSASIAVDPLPVAHCSFPDSHLDLKFLTPLSDFTPLRSVILLI
jgi:hypothetical protein